MKLNVYSYYDNLAKNSLFIVMHHSDAEAEREFDIATDNEHFQKYGNDLQLVKIGSFDTSTLDMSSCDKIVICYGVSKEVNKDA